MPMPGRFRCYSCGEEHRRIERAIDFEYRNFILARGRSCEARPEVIEHHRKRMLRETYPAKNELS